MSGIIITVLLFSVPNSRAATISAIAVVVPTFASLAFATWQAIVEREDLASRANDLAESVAAEWEGHRLALLGNYAVPADVEFAQVKLDELVRYRVAGGPSRGRMMEVLKFFHELNPSRLVIVGAAGSGKTVLAIELLIALLANRDSKEDGQAQVERRRVPVLLSLSSWDTRQTLQGWITNHLVTTYRMRRGTARRLIGGHWIIPVLDGLDEMDADLEKGPAADVVRQLNQYANFNSLGPLVLTCREEQYLALAGSADQGIQDAAVVRIKPLNADQIITYLSRRYPAQPRRPRASDEWSEVCRHMKRYPHGFLVLALSTPWRLMLATAACDAGQTSPASMMTYRTAKDMDDQLLRRFVPSAVAIFMPGASQAEAENRTDRTERWLGRLAAILDQAGPGIVLQDFWRIRARKEVRWLHAFISVPGSALLGLLGAEIASGSGGLAVAFSFMAIGIAFGTWAAVDPDPLPSRISLRRLRDWHYSLPVLAFGIALGSITIIQSGWRIGFTAWLLATLAGAIFVGLRQGATSVATPGDPLKNDLIFGIVLGLVGGAYAGLPGGLTGGFLTTIGTKRTLGFWPSVILALVLGIICGISIGSRAWLRYAVTLALEALPGRLPWRLNGFLEWSYKAGLLHISGLAYQFRHDNLKIWLSTRYEASRNSSSASPQK